MSTKISSATETVFLSTPVVVGGVFTVYVLFCIAGSRTLFSRIPVRIMFTVFLALTINSISWFINIVVAAQMQTTFSGSLTCLINAYIITSMQFGIMGMLLFVIVDQYIACTMPLRYRIIMTLNKCTRITAGIWLVMSLFELPLLISMGRIHGDGPAYYSLIGICYASYNFTDRSKSYLLYVSWSLVEVAVVYVFPIYVMIHLSYNSYRVMHHRKRASIFSAKAELELKEQMSKATKLVEKQSKPIEKDKNENLKAILSLYAKPMVKTSLILCFVLMSLVSHCLLRFFDPITQYLGETSSEGLQLAVNCLRNAVCLGLILSAGRIVGSLQLIILRNRYC